MQRVVCVVALLFGLVIQGGMGSAHAESLSRLDKAEGLFFEGVAAYQKKQYETAARAFQGAYLITQDRTLLFNVARCHERLGDKKAASQWYTAYLDSKPVDETAVIHHLSQLGVDVSDRKDSSAGRGRIVRRAEAKVELQPASYRWTKWGLLGMGVSGLLAGTLVGVEALDDARKSRETEDSVETEHWARQAERNALAADVLLFTGAVATGVSVYFFISEALTDDESVTVLPQEGGAAMIYSARF